MPEHHVPSVGDFKERDILRRKIMNIIDVEGKELAESDWEGILKNLHYTHPDACRKYSIRDADSLKSFILKTAFFEKKQSGPSDLTVEEEKKMNDDFIGYDERVPGLAKLSVSEVERIALYMLKYRQEVTHFMFEPMHLKRILECPRAKEILMEAATLNPYSVIRYPQRYKNIPYATEILHRGIFSPEMRFESSWLEILDDREVYSAKEKESALAMIDKAQKYRADVRYLQADPLHTEKISELYTDQALQKMPTVNEDWLDWQKAAPYVPVIKKVQYRAMIARNLYFQGKDIDKGTAKKEFERIIRTRNEYKNVALFKDRHVLMAAHNEDLGFRWRFGKPAAQEAIKKQMGKKTEFILIRPQSTPESLKEAKENALRQIRTTPPPFTFIFDGHGGPDALYFCDGAVSDGKIVENQNTIKITDEELANAFKERAKKFPIKQKENVDKKDIIVLLSCYNATFIRNFFEKLQDAPKPIALGESEYGQYGYSDFESNYGSKFFSNVLSLSADNHVTTIGTVFEHEFEGDSNPSIYIPDELNRTMQITKEQRQTPDSHATL